MNVKSSGDRELIISNDKGESLVITFPEANQLQADIRRIFIEGGLTLTTWS
jgi:hypothetical protein